MSLIDESAPIYGFYDAATHQFYAFESRQDYEEALSILQELEKNHETAESKTTS